MLEVIKTAPKRPILLLVANAGSILVDGTIDAIATDHAPHAVHEKEVEFERAPNGIIGLETALGLSLRWLHREWKLPLGRVLNMMSAQPAALLNLKGRGTLTVGSFADVLKHRLGEIHGALCSVGR